MTNITYMPWRWNGKIHGCGDTPRTHMISTHTWSILENCHDFDAWLGKESLYCGLNNINQAFKCDLLCNGSKTVHEVFRERSHSHWGITSVNDLIGQILIQWMFQEIGWMINRIQNSAQNCNFFSQKYAINKGWIHSETRGPLWYPRRGILKAFNLPCGSASTRQKVGKWRLSQRSRKNNRVSTSGKPLPCEREIISIAAWQFIVLSLDARRHGSLWRGSETPCDVEHSDPATSEMTHLSQQWEHIERMTSNLA